MRKSISSRPTLLQHNNNVELLDLRYRGDGPAPRVERNLPEPGASSAAAQPKKRPVSERQNFAEAVAQERRRVQASLPMESRSQADSEATDVKIDEDSSQDRDKGNTKEIANKLKGSSLLEQKQERDELKIQLQNYKPFHQPEARAKASKALEGAKREEADIVELLALKRAEVNQFKANPSPAQQQCRIVGSEISDGGWQCRNHQEFRRWQRHSRRSSGPRGFGAGRLRRLLQGAQTKPRLRGCSAHCRDTCHTGRACSQDAAGNWSFRTVPEARGKSRCHDRTHKVRAKVRCSCALLLTTDILVHAADEGVGAVQMLRMKSVARSCPREFLQMVLADIAVWNTKLLRQRARWPKCLLTTDRHTASLPHDITWSS